MRFEKLFFLMIFGLLSWAQAEVPVEYQLNLNTLLARSDYSRATRHSKYIKEQGSQIFCLTQSINLDETGRRVATHRCGFTTPPLENSNGLTDGIDGGGEVWVILLEYSDSTFKPVFFKRELQNGSIIEFDLLHSDIRQAPEVAEYIRGILALASEHLGFPRVQLELPILTLESLQRFCHRLRLIIENLKAVIEQKNRIILEKDQKIAELESQLAAQRQLPSVQQSQSRMGATIGTPPSDSLSFEEIERLLGI